MTSTKDRERAASLIERRERVTFASDVVVTVLAWMGGVALVALVALPTGYLLDHLWTGVFITVVAAILWGLIGYAEFVSDERAIMRERERRAAEDDSDS